MSRGRGIPSGYDVQPAYRQSYTRPYRPVREGWNLLRETEYGNPEWLQTFETKAEAVSAAWLCKAEE